MSDDTLRPDPDHDLLLAVLALQLDFLARADLQLVLHAWDTDRTRDLGLLLVEQGLLSSPRLEMLQRLAQEYLLQHDREARRALDAACAARPRLDSAAMVALTRNNGEGTLPSSPPTIAESCPATPSASSVLPPLPMQRRFRILHPHARGALGEIYLAHDEELDRQVALKEIQSPYANNRECRIRFLMEAEITGGLEHPGIVPVYSLGRYADGRPYYAMRFIRGESLHDGIRNFHNADQTRRDPGERALALRGLLGRFIAVCNAIAYAHSRGVVHRDIKPGNIMLGSYGETLVVDWGLAKAFDRPMTNDSTELPMQPPSAEMAQATMLGQAVGTPSFMSPEQAAGRIDQINASSDIYSLGGTLYQILTGVPPVDGINVTEIMNKVQRHDFPPPRKVNRQVPAPLEAIVLRAMALEPTQRYGTVKEMAQDVERWLADEPVTAYREPFIESSQRWMRRNRSLVAGLAALVLTTLVGLGVILWAVQREQAATARERDIAHQNLELARKAVDDCFVLSTETPLLQQDRMRGVRKLLLEAALPFYQGFQSARPDSAGILFDDGQNHFRIAVITAEIGKKADALPHYVRARQALERLSEAYPEMDSLRVDLARVLNNLGVLQKDLGQRDEAGQTLEDCRVLREQLTRKEADRAEHQSDLAATLNNLADLYREEGKPAEALERFEEARKLLSWLVSEHGDEPRYRSDLAATLHNLGRLHFELGKIDDALKAYEESRKFREQLVAKNQNEIRLRGNLASTLLNQAAALFRGRYYEQARKTWEQALTLCEALVREDGEVNEYRSDLARACNGLGSLLRVQGEPARAAQLHRRALDLLQGLRRIDDAPGTRMDLAGTSLNLGHALRDQHGGEDRAAITAYSQAIDQVRGLRAAERDSTEGREVLMQALRARAVLRARLGEVPASLLDFQQALDLADAEERPGIRMERAFVLARAGRHEQASAEVSELEKSQPGNAEVFYNLACVCALASKTATGKPAESLADRAVRLLERARQGGLFREAARREHLDRDDDLVPLRQRADYRALLKRLEKQSP